MHDAKRDDEQRDRFFVLLFRCSQEPSLCLQKEQKPGNVMLLGIFVIAMRILRYGLLRAKRSNLDEQ